MIRNRIPQFLSQRSVRGELPLVIAACLVSGCARTPRYVDTPLTKDQMEVLAQPKVVWVQDDSRQNLNASDLTLDLALALREAGSARTIEKLNETSFKTSTDYCKWLPNGIVAMRVYSTSLVEVVSDADGNAARIVVRSPGIVKALDSGQTWAESDYEWLCKQDREAIRQHFEGKPLHDGFRMKADRFREIWRSMPVGFIVEPPTNEHAHR